MDRLLELNNPLFYNEMVAIHKTVYDKFQALEESAFRWMDGVLDDARKAFNQSDVCLLPKTPSAKEKGRRKKKSKETARRKIKVDEQDDYVPSTEEKDTRPSRQAKKRGQQYAESNDDFEDEPSTKTSKAEKSPVRQRTRAASRAATTSRARNTRAAKQTKKNKSRSQEPVVVIEQLIKPAGEEQEFCTPTKQSNNREIEKSNNHEIEKSNNREIEMDESVREVIDVWVQPADRSIKAPGESGKKRSKSELEESVYEVEETWTQSVNMPICAPEVFRKSEVKITNQKTPFQNFGSMNVKERVHAYEEIILISPATTNSKKMSISPRNNIMQTPPNSTVQQTTPDTVVQRETVDRTQDTPVSRADCSAMKNRESLASRRSSVRKSLKELPSSTKIQSLHPEPAAKPVRTRTRLRLKKKEQKTEETDNEQDTASSVTSGKGTDSSEDMEVDSQQEEPSTPQNKGRTRSQGRAETEEPEQASGQSSHSGTVEMSRPDSCSDEATSPKPTRSTRTKTRQPQNQQAVVETEKTPRKDSGVGGSCSSVEGDGMPRVTRSKMRKPKQATTEVQESDRNVAASPAVPRVTRTKTRKRQHDEESDNERSRPKRSCTSNISTASDTVGDKTNDGTTEEDSSDSDVESPQCPRAKIVRPVPSFLNSLNKNSHNPVKPANLHAGGLVKSFIARNSPAPKPTLKEIHEKRKHELAEKEKKEKERLKKREEEHKKKVEEMRKKREEKMKKVHDMREFRQQKEKEDRLQIEKKLAEKRQHTQKIREERIREDKEKQKMRLQKMEEAEERRKQDEDERRKKQHELREQERFHQEMLQRKKEFEEQERLQKIEDEKRRAAERQQEIEREREKERERLVRIEEEKKKEWQKKREERERQLAQERADKEKLDLEKRRERELQMKKEMERIREQERLRLAEQEKIKEQQRKRDEELKKMVEKHNTQVQQGKQLPKPNLNKTHSLNEPTVQHNSSTNNDSYEMTPKKVPIPSTMENYGIEDLNSGDETDDDERPRKKIPDWAQGSQLKTLLIKQHYHPPNLDELFDVIDPPDLNVLFEKKKARFNKRTSSAHWDSPILKPGTLGRV